MDFLRQQFPQSQGSTPSEAAQVMPAITAQPAVNMLDVLNQGAPISEAAVLPSMTPGLEPPTPPIDPTPASTPTPPIDPTPALTPAPPSMTPGLESPTPPAPDIGADLAEATLGSSPLIGYTERDGKFQRTPAPPGFTRSGGSLSQALVPFYNPTTGESWTAPSGGYTPPPGWVGGNPPQTPPPPQPAPSPLDLAPPPPQMAQPAPVPVPQPTLAPTPVPQPQVPQPQVPQPQQPVYQPTIGPQPTPPPQAAPRPRIMREYGESMEDYWERRDNRRDNI